MILGYTLTTFPKSLTQTENNKKNHTHISTELRAVEGPCTPAFFQHLMNKVLDNCPFAMTYLDDIIIFSDTEEEHLAHIEEIFKRLEAADLKMKRSKCDFFQKHIHYLGHLISADGIRPLKDKLDTIRDMPAPRNSKEVKQFLGLVGYYRKFVPRFADH